MATNGGIGNAQYGSQMDIIKSQLLMLFSFKGNDNVFGAVWALILILIVENIIKLIPYLFNMVNEYIKKNIEKKTGYVLPLIVDMDNIVENSVILTRVYKLNSGEQHSSDKVIENEFVDAIIEYICSLDNAKHLRYTNRFMINNMNTIVINKDLSAKMLSIDINNVTNDVNNVSIKIFSKTLKISDIKEHLNKLYSNYKIEKCNKLGNQKYYFNEIHIPPIDDIDGGYRYDTAPKRITFSITPFNTFKSINNIYGEHIDRVRERINLFINNEEWYEARGIPHTLGILLHGQPGCGKTSLIKAIAHDTKRHVFNITLRKTTTQGQLLNLFFDENINISNSLNETSVIAIPLDQRIYVIEDIDCMCNVVLDRKFLELLALKKKGKPYNVDEYKKFVDNDDDENNINISDIIDDENNDNDYDNGDNENNIDRNQLPYSQQINSYFQPILNKKETNKIAKNKIKKQSNNKLTLSFLLNLFDGVLETPNRILIMTSNYVKRIDRALIRPGRIDLNIEFTNASLNVIYKILSNFYNKTFDEIVKLNLDRNIDGKLTPAEVIEILCNNYNNITNAITHLNNKIHNNSAAI